MANVINATSTGNGGLITTGDDSGILNIQTNETTAVSVDASQNLTFTNAINAPNTFGFKNRIINGAMAIDQRNAGASVTPINGQYTVDRWWYSAAQTNKFTVQQTPSATETGYAVRVAAGFTNYLALTSQSAYSLGSGDYFGIVQTLEGYNISDLAWGTSSAATITLSFWVNCSITGTYSVVFSPSGVGYTYAATYTVNAANTWEKKTITIPGPSVGTWLTTNGTGLRVMWSVGAGSSWLTAAGSWVSGQYLAATGQTSVVGTNGATFYITGAQLEKGTQATSFDFRDYGRELILCQRYFNMVANYNQSGGNSAIGNSVMVASTDMRIIYNFPVQMRSAPSIVATNTSQDFRIYNGGNFYLTTLTTDFSSKNGISMVSGGGLSGATQGQGGILFAQQAGAYFALNSEL